MSNLNLRERTIKVSAMRTSITEEDLRNLFKAVGDIQQVRMGKEDAFIVFEESESVESALIQDGHQLKGSEIQVAQANSNSLSDEDDPQQSYEFIISPKQTDTTRDVKNISNKVESVQEQPKEDHSSPEAIEHESQLHGRTEKVDDKKQIEFINHQQEAAKQASQLGMHEDLSKNQANQSSPSMSTNVEKQDQSYTASESTCYEISQSEVSKKHEQATSAKSFEDSALKKEYKPQSPRRDIQEESTKKEAKQQQIMRDLQQHSPECEKKFELPMKVSQQGEESQKYPKFEDSSQRPQENPEPVPEKAKPSNKSSSSIEESQKPSTQLQSSDQQSKASLQKSSKISDNSGNKRGQTEITSPSTVDNKRLFKTLQETNLPNNQRLPENDVFKSIFEPRYVTLVFSVWVFYMTMVSLFA